jgi:hypothetical protein
MKCRLSSSLNAPHSLITRAVLFLSLATVPAFSQTHILNALPGVAGSRGKIQLPQGMALVGSLPLGGQPIARLYTQWEYSRTYLYIEHGPQSLTVIDVTAKRNPQIVSHSPAKITPVQYEELAEGGTIEVSPLWAVNPGLDTVGGRGTLSVLSNAKQRDAALLNAAGPEYSNLADRDHRLVYLVSASQLLIVQDRRFAGMDVY